VGDAKTALPFKGTSSHAVSTQSVALAFAATKAAAARCVPPEQESPKSQKLENLHQAQTSVLSKAALAEQNRSSRRSCQYFARFAQFEAALGINVLIAQAVHPVIANRRPSLAKVSMLVTLVAILCNGQLCLEKVVTTSEQSGITMTACQVNAQLGIAEWLANSPYHDWSLQSYKCILGKYPKANHEARQFLIAKLPGSTAEG
jgi:hypothetical protein